MARDTAPSVSRSNHFHGRPVTDKWTDTQPKNLMIVSFNHQAVLRYLYVHVHCMKQHNPTQSVKI